MQQKTMKQLKTWTVLIVPTLVLMMFFKISINFIMTASPDDAQLAERISSAAPYILIFNHLILFALLLFVLKVAKLTFKDLGLKFDLKEILLGFLVGFGLFSFQHFVTLPLLARFDLFTYWTGFPGMVYLISATLFAGILEESIFRGYGLTSFLKAQTNPTAALLMTTAAFALFHYGQGWAGMINAAVMGLVLGAVYMSRKNLPSVMAAHAFANFLFIMNMANQA